MKRITHIITLPILFILTTGCATLVSKTSQTVHVQAIDHQTHRIIKNARCTLKDNNNVLYALRSNPGAVNLPRVYGKLEVRCHATAYQQKELRVGESFNPVTLGNWLYLPGYIIDIASGAAKKYPAYITVLMRKN